MQQPTIWQFSRMRSKGSRFTLGIFGVEGVFAIDVAQPFVRHRSYEVPMAVPLGVLKN